ncbi:MAG: phosphonate ABC transporter, permease protein PhnE [Actinomycetota bacterium]|nr:phosphonate ABC transporter, permease protein PhnE [Actinomycetota bacterium]MDQ3575704.1 phosphonate ABC transporter, permease protein PhnE [Actinomycetota bacterium]
MSAIDSSTTQTAPALVPADGGRSPRGRLMGRRSLGRRLGWGALLAALVVWSMRGAGVSPGTLTGAEARRQIGDFVSEFLRPEVSAAYLGEVGRAAIETLHISITSLVIGVAIGAPLCLFAASNLSSGAGSALPAWQRALRFGPYWAARGTLNVLRAIPELVWALIFITAVGLGPFAGAMAIGLHAGGLLGKLWAEQLEAVDPAPVEAVRLLGMGRLGVVSLGVIPQARRNLISIGMYQWECNVRAATIVGFVGAGGIGQQVDVSIRLFRYSETSTLVLTILVMVFAADGLSTLVRRALR